MKQFFKFMLASALGVIISVFLLFFLIAAIIGGIVSSASEEKHKTIEANSVLMLKLDYMIAERTSKNPFEQFNFNTFESNKTTGLNDILKAIKGAEENENINGIYLNLSVSPNDYATLEAIRAELINFKKSKKFIVAYSELLEEHSYYLASVADEIFLNPSGELLMDGFSSTTPYLKGMFNKLGIEPQLIRHGKFKSAGEPLIADKMSDANREQTEVYLGSMYDNFVNAIAKSRKKSSDEIKQMIDNLSIQSPEDAKRLGMITGIMFEDQVHDFLIKKVGVDKFDDIEMVSAAEVAQTVKGEPYSVKEKIAVIYCIGDIVSGKGDGQTMGSTTIVESLRKAKNDSNIKAVVLRINSPGGSAMASDVMWREVVLTKKVKPVIVSMGATAASGGYYIAAPADIIVAEQNTITGSIGVFALLVNAQKLIEEKLGVNMETVKFGQYADMGTANRALTKAEQAIIQKYIDRIYTDFITKVAEGRKLTLQQVDSIAQGRVWSGSDAKKIGLIDEFGGLNKAIQIAAQKVNLKEYRISSFPEQKEPFEQFMESIGEEASTYMAKQKFGQHYEWYSQISKLLKYEGMQMRMPTAIEIN